MAPTRSACWCSGPTGTGKELVARALHACSPRAPGPFVAIHCGALSAELLESELFGHMKGSFTGAYRDQPGLVEAAHGGTLFLDEVGEMPPPMQVKLLRFLQEGTFVPVGGRVQKRADVRVVAATHRDLEAMVRERQLPRGPVLSAEGRGAAHARAGRAAGRRGAAGVALPAPRRAAQPASRAGALAWLDAREWPGNVRELKAVVESAGALILPDQHEVDADLLRLCHRRHRGDGAAARRRAASTRPPARSTPRSNELELRLVRDAMAAAGGNQSEAARRLGVSRVGLIKKLTRLGLR